MLITRIGMRIGLDNIHRFQPRDSHIPENGFALVPAAIALTGAVWPTRRLRPLTIFPPEPVTAQGNPPHSFRWRQMRFRTGRAHGPERIAPEWWQPDQQHTGTGAHSSAEARVGPSKTVGRQLHQYDTRSSQIDHPRSGPPGFGQPATKQRDLAHAASFRSALSQGVRDYWCIETLEGPRLWLFHTPQQPSWFVQGEFL